MSAIHLIRQERARWRRRDGSTAVWRADGWLVIRIGPAGRYRPRGCARTAATALALLPGGADSWQRLGKGPEELAPATRRSAPRLVSTFELAGTVEANGVAVDAGRSNGTAAMRLARVAAYRLRWLTTGRLRQHRPPDLAEALAALFDPRSTLNAAERAIVLAELGDGGGNGDE